MFPTFLWEAAPDVIGRTWAGRAVQAGKTWSEGTEVTVRKSEFVITATGRNNTCDDHVTEADCRRPIGRHAIVCLSEEPNGSFRVHVRSKGYGV